MKWLLLLLVACKANAPAEQGSAAPPPAPRISQGVLPRLPPLPAGDAKKIELGHALFFDDRLSNQGSCYSCHRNEDGTGGHGPAPRHAPVLWNVGYYDGAFYWDGRATSLDGVGLDSYNVEPIAAAYKQPFEAAFPGKPPGTAEIAAALSEYERTLICNDTAYDKFAAGDKTAMTDQQQRGLDVFVDKAGCVTCHAPPYFSTAQARPGGIYFKVIDSDDAGRMNVTHDPKDKGKFKPPTLRNITRSAPYFHDGSVASLDKAIDHGNPITAAERADLLAFLAALDCPEKLAP